jgi:hypothetical protein
MIGDAGSVAPGAALTLWQGARCSFSFVSLRQGDRVQLLFGDTVIDEHNVDSDAAPPFGRAEPGDAANTLRVHERRLADAIAAPAATFASGNGKLATTQDLAAAFASFAVAGVGTTPMPQLAASTASIVAPRRTAEAGALVLAC